MLSERCTICMGRRHVMSSERISHTVTQTIHLLSTQAFCDLRGAAVLPHLVGDGYDGPSLRRSAHPQPTFDLCSLKRVWWVESMQLYLILILDETPCLDAA